MSHVFTFLAHYTTVNIAQGSPAKENSENESRQNMPVRRILDHEIHTRPLYIVYIVTQTLIGIGELDDSMISMTR